MLRAFRDAWRRDGWVRPYLSRYRGVLAAAVVLSVVAYAFAAALMFTSGYMISLAATIPFTVLALHVPSIFVRVFGIGKPVAQYVERLASHDWVLRMTSSLRVRLYRAVEAGKPRGSKASYGRMLSLFASDIEHVQDLYLRTVIPLVVMIVMYALVVVALGVFSPAMAATFLLSIGVVLVVMPLWSVAANGAATARRQALVAEAYDAAVEDVIGVVDWRLSGRREDFAAKAAGIAERKRACDVATRRFDRRLAVARQAVFAASISVLFVWAAWAFGDGGAPSGLFATGVADALGNVAMHDSVPRSANWIAAFVLCAFPLMEVFAPASDAALGFVRHEASIRELGELDASGAAGGGPGVIAAAAMGVGVRDGRNAVELEGVSFSHGERPVYEGLTLSIPKGQRVAVIGKSGSGKSTLLDLMRGEVAPDAGRIGVDGSIGIIEQAPYVFRKSLRENLLLADPSADDARITDALSKVGLAPLLDSLPEGLDAPVAEGGITLSGGERHRLALARIILSERDIVFLDEPYLGLDADTEREVASVVLDVLADKTLVVVTHHLQGIEAYDRVVMVGEGRIEADGAPDELASGNPRFRRLLRFDRGEENNLPKSEISSIT